MTLVEIMVVIAILGMLMGALAFGVFDALEQAKVSTTQIIVRQADQGLAQYAARHRGALPSAEDGLQSAAPFVSRTEDAWDRELIYTRPSALVPEERYDLVSLGRDGLEGGDGYDADITNWSLVD